MNQDNNPNEPLNPNRANPQLLHQHDNPPRFQGVKQKLFSFLVIVGFCIMINMVQELRAQNQILQAKLESNMDFKTIIAIQRQARDDSRAELEELKKNIMINVTSQTEQIRLQFEETLKENQDLKAESVELKRSVTKLITDLEESKKNIMTNVTSQTEQIRFQFEERLRKENQELKAESVELKRSLTKLITDLEELKKNIMTNVTSQTEQMQQQLDESKSENQSLKAELQELKQIFATQGTNQMNQILVTVRSENEKLQTEVASLRESIKRHEEIRTEQQRQLDELQRSTTDKFKKIFHQESGNFLPGDTTPFGSLIGRPNYEVCYDHSIRFERPFVSQPTVVLSLSGVDSSNEVGLKPRVEARSVTVNGFVARACALWNHVSHKISVTWHASDDSSERE